MSSKPYIQAARAIILSPQDEVLLIRRSELDTRSPEQFVLPGDFVESVDIDKARVEGALTITEQSAFRYLQDKLGLNEYIQRHDVFQSMGKLMIKECQTAEIFMYGIGVVGVTSVLVHLKSKQQPIFTGVYDPSQEKYVLEHDNALWIPKKELGTHSDLEVFWPILRGFSPFSE